MSDETNTYGDDIHLTTTDATTIYNTLIAALEKGAGEPLYPGDERRIFGEGLVAVFVALYNSLDDTGRQTLLRYARGEVLDAIGERLDVHRLEGSPAKTTMRFSVSTPQPNNIIIPKWTKVTPDSDHYFATDEIAVLQAGAYSVEIPTSAVSNGTEYNGYAPGTITTLVDLIPYIESVTNITATAGGDDGEPYTEEGDNRLRERIRLAPASRSTAGPEQAYIYWAMTADSSIIDARAVSETETISRTLTVYDGHAFIGGGRLLPDTLIVKEHATLLYPEGTACADVLLAGEEGGANASTVFSGMGLAAIFKFIVDGLKMIPADIAVAFSSFKGALGMEVYPALLGVGYIVGPKTASYMFTGSLVGWMVIIPLICLFGANISLYPAAAGTTIADLYAAGGADAIWSNYVKYIGAGAIATGGIISLIKSLPLIASTFRDAMKSMKGGSASGTSRTEKDLPMPFILGGILLIILIIWLAPAIPVSPLGALLIVIFGFFFSTVSARMVGMIGSSNNPVSGMTIATLLIATMILKATGNVGIEGMIGSMAIASVICICAAIAADTSQDLKTGYLLGATPVKQQIGELIGVIAAGLAIGGVLYLLDSAWGYGGAEVPAPQATLMKMIVEGIMGGNLPWNLVFTGVFLAIALEVLRIPVMPFAIGLYLPIYLNTSIMIGGAVRWFMDSRKNVDAKLKEEQTTRGTLFCAGMIAGEGLVGILLAVFAVFGISTALSIDLGNIGGVVLMIVMIACLLAFSMKKKKN